MKKNKTLLVLAGIITSIGLLKGQALATAATPTQAQKVDSQPDLVPEMKVKAYLREPQFWVSPEYVHYWQNSTSPLPEMLDALDATGTIVTPIYDQRRTTFSDGNAVRLTVGGWVDPDEKYGVELSGFYTPKQSQTDSFTGTPTGPTLVASYDSYDPAGNITVHRLQLGGPIAGGGTQGGATFTSTTESYSGEGNFVLHIFDYAYKRQVFFDVNGLGGFRYFGVADEFQESLNREVLPAGQGGRHDFSATDVYQTQNNFYGANLGAHIRARYQGFFAELTPKIGLGVTEESVDVSGSANASLLGVPDPALNPGGFLAIGNKLGNRSTDKFAVLPQLSLKVGYDLTQHVELFVGYDLLYLSEVARATGQVNNQVDRSTSPFATFGGAAGASDSSPKPAISSTSLFEQGVTAGVTAKF